MSRRLALLALALLTGLPAAAQITLPANPSLCADLAVSVRLAEGRDHRRAVFEVRNIGPGATASGRGAVALATALTANGAPDQLDRFDLGGMAAGEARSFTVTRAGHDPVMAWGAIQFAPGTPTDCNPANNTAVQAAS
jgi:hypothetical protein